MAGALLCGFLALLAGAGCAHHPVNPGYTGPKELPPWALARYALEKKPLLYTDSVIEERRRYSIRRVQFPAVRTAANGAAALVTQELVTIEYYRVKGSATTPAIVVLPMLKGSNWESRLFCEYFADHGYSALIVHRDQKQRDNLDLATVEAGLRQIVLDHKLALDWVESQPDLDPGRIGVFGISMGGIKAALVAALDPRVRAAVLALAGGDLPYILTHSSERSIVRQVEALMREHRVGRKDLALLLAGEISTDPLSFADFIDARNVLMILGVFDTVVPYEKGKELAAAIGGPESILLPTGHYSSLPYVFYVRGASLDFFARTFTRAAAPRSDGKQAVER